MHEYIANIEGYIAETLILIRLFPHRGDYYRKQIIGLHLMLAEYRGYEDGRMN
jgi:hypothetical protein